MTLGLGPGRTGRALPGQPVERTGQQDVMPTGDAVPLGSARPPTEIESSDQVGRGSRSDTGSPPFSPAHGGTGGDRTRRPAEGPEPAAVFMSWVSRLFDRRMLPLRLLILLTCAVGYLVQLRDPATPVRPVDWVLAMTAVAVSAGSGRWPLAIVLVQSALLGTAEQVGASLLVPIKVGASLAVFELAM
ncbi:hypothetical protein [Plantactinospora sp. KLBMP9567]|uniref:hypothetical protein n=1 Tax=Plantactinospora sp. KLBMP9567 TaxID=3085900 RepID=UPI0029823BDF|nr:hypothetical protein [Plantactinospora sp. KLBMP9567]MDW5322361.1 hypothetical protein [Plantactinospora sp. KLBMP9567]